MCGGFRIAFLPEPEFFLLGTDDTLAAKLLVVGDFTVRELAVFLDQDGDGHAGDGDGQQQDGQEEDFHGCDAVRAV